MGFISAAIIIITLSVIVLVVDSVKFGFAE
jgi:hypothetical protein